MVTHLQMMGYGSASAQHGIADRPLQSSVGAIVVGWAQPGTVPHVQEKLLKTCADQAVIAIENVRLSRELQARTKELGRSVDQLRSLSEVGQAVNSTLELEQVLDAPGLLIVERAFARAPTSALGVEKANPRMQATDE